MGEWKMEPDSNPADGPSFREPGLLYPGKKLQDSFCQLEGGSVCGKGRAQNSFGVAKSFCPVINMSQLSMNTHTYPIIRSNLYKLLSIGFHYPDPENFKTFQNGYFLDELMYNISLIPELNAIILEYFHMAQHGRDDMKGMTLAEFEMEFTRIFDAGSPIPVCLS